MSFDDDVPLGVLIALFIAAVLVGLAINFAISYVVVWCLAEIGVVSGVTLPHIVLVMVILFLIGSLRS